MEFGSLSVLPPLLVIVLAIMSHDVVISLLVGIFSGHLIVNNFNLLNTIIALLDNIIDLFAEGWIVKTLLFSLMAGAIMRLLIDSGGTAGLLHFLTQRSRTIRSGKGALLLAYVIGLLIFIESSIASLAAGTVTRPLCDRFGTSKQKLAYICDSTSAPTCSLIALNGWGALLIGLITTQVTDGMLSGNPTRLFIGSIPFNFYAWITLIIALVVILKGWDIGVMREYEHHAKPTKPAHSPAGTHLSRILIPLSVLIGMMPISLYYTGHGNLMEGNAPSSVLYAVLASLFVSFLQYVILGNGMNRAEWFKSFYHGLSEMLPIVLILVLAFSISDITKNMGTGQYLASLATGIITPSIIPVIVFLLSGAITFATGTSWATFSIMLPIGVSLAVTTGANVELVIGAVVSGGVFGNHCSPISNTTIISSMVTGCELIEHVNSQLPYALIGGGIASGLFIIAGLLLV
ncbi:Na+/H+ antiporter NhaC family protein [Candidatus Thiothrix sp. Deng01]|uniref:Na+/H+ antiporter NhaC family protein n=1 Tax=Candidatus Thiothrix phosphatis TaxID=3112415 RepID=A0ABU6D2K3_9GAMM|nr:Na+/H+ antiporter NhaC family protein [Candidatus Thiothrix sp. Deng01]MEB4593295.1 Na+/H+ antiporter NhaC family protein [Candidatus Thiothrix sp. Deng01]